ncbi:MAG: bifunctional ligase/repressor BirA [marine bacterium B5-7]|nr:MAG: bifunctional ligase/repressor BirA [marine bacterium B5-7]
MQKLHPNFTRLLELLADGEYHDGTSLGAQLGITRAAVWKFIQKLMQYGIEVDSIKGKGYRLATPFSLLDAKKITQNLTHPRQVQVAVFEKLDSTNRYLRDLGDIVCPQACVAETMLAGRGRLGRHWVAPFGQNLYFSYAFPFQKDISELAGLSLIAGLATVAALKQCMPDIPFALKWPNDVLVGGSKLVGILVEVQAESNGACTAIIGIGVNVNMSMQTPASAEISQAWASLFSVSGQSTDRNLLAALLLDQLNVSLDRFVETGFSDFVAEWECADCLLGQEITVKNHDKQWQGQVLGVNTLGQLRLLTENGEEKTISAGDTTILKKNSEKPL